MVARVIKQNVTFRNSSIGVVRADRGGEQLEKDIQSSADSLIKNAFKIANDEAIKKGQELANNLSADQLRAINPETGNLEVLDNSPLLAGLSQRTTFKQVVDKDLDTRSNKISNKKLQNLVSNIKTTLR